MVSEYVVAPPPAWMTVLPLGLLIRYVKKKMGGKRRCIPWVGEVVHGLGSEGEEKGDNAECSEKAFHCNGNRNERDKIKKRKEATMESVTVEERKVVFQRE